VGVGPVAHAGLDVVTQPFATETLANEVAVLLLLDVAEAYRLWGWSRFVIGRFSMARVPGLRFYKVLGSGHEWGFGLRPSGSLQGLFCLFDDAAGADAFLQTSRLVRAYQRHAQEFFTVKLRAFSSRGTWAGTRFQVSAPAPATGPIAALTRASIRPAAARSFWHNAPLTQGSLELAQGCRMAAGVGEAPIFRQATFSVWDSVQCMDAYARTGAHLQAIQAAHRLRYFSESMFVRFVPEDMRGTWKGRSFG
jgi:hypothetical protein